MKELQVITPESVKPRVFLFINSSAPEWYVGMALAEDGCFLASHVSSSPAWARHDMGLTSDWKHTAYKAHYPDGYEVEWVDDVRGHAGLMAAYALNQQQAAGAIPPEVQPETRRPSEVQAHAASDGTRRESHEGLCG